MDSSRLISTGSAANALSFTGIRAPLTIDDDSDELEYSSSLSNAEYDSNSYTSSHNISGEDDFGSGSDSEMDDSDPNEQTPFVNFRPTVEYSEGESIEEKSNLDDSLTSPDIINVEYRRGIPIALLSVDNDDDDDSEGSIVLMEDDGERIESAPKVRVLIDEGDENVIQPDIILAEAGVEYENAQEKQVIVDNAQSLVSDYVEQQIAECTFPDSDCDVEEIKVECGVTSKEPLTLLVSEIEPSGMQLEEEEEEDIQSRDIEIVNLDIIDSKPKELNSFATDDDNRVGETASLTQIGKVKQEIHHIKGNEVQSSHSAAENVQIFSQADTTTQGDELSRDSKISQSVAINSLPELQISNNCAFKSETSFSFNNDNEEVKESSIDESEYRFDGERCLNIDGEVDTIEENKEKEKFDETAALLKAVGLGSTLVSQLLQDSNFFAHAEGTFLSEAEAERSKLEKIQKLRVNFLNIINKLNQPPEDAIRKPLPTEALQFEADDGRNLLCLNVLVIGKTGVGKSATINSIFHEHKTATNAFKPATTTVKEIVGILQEGVMVRVLDTPGLRSSIPEQMYNRKILLSIKKAMIRCPPDVVLYVDRLDIQTSRDDLLCDLMLLKSVTTYLGPSIWDKTIVTLTHAASSPPDGPTGKPLSYETFVAQRSNDIQQLINHSVGDLHLHVRSSPISLVENQHSRNGNGENWRSQLLLLCCSMKIVSELTCVVKTDFQRLDSESKLKLLPYFSNSDKNEYEPSLKWGRSCKVAIRAEELNKKLSGRICIRTSSLDYTQIAILCIVTVAKDIMRRIYPHKL